MAERNNRSSLAALLPDDFLYVNEVQNVVIHNHKILQHVMVLKASQKHLKNPLVAWLPKTNHLWKFIGRSALYDMSNE